MSTHKSQTETSISRLSETAYGTARLFNASFRRILNDNQGTDDFDKSFGDDSEYDAGSDLANDMWCLTNSTGLPLTPDFNFQDAPYLFHDILGSTVSAASFGSLFQHTQTPQSMNTSRQLPSRTILKKYGGLGIKAFRSMVAQNLTVSGGKTGRIKMAASYMGDGYIAETGLDINGGAYVSPAITADREWGFCGQVNPSISLAASGGTAQVETATAAGTATGTGAITVTITSNYFTSPVVLTPNIASGDTPSIWAQTVRVALLQNAQISARFIVGGSSTAIVLTDRQKRADDVTLNIAITAGTTGITAAPTSANTTAGVVGNSQDYSCALETWQLNLNNPPAADGYRQCSPYLTSGVPESGSVRSELLCGKRDYTFDWTARLLTGDKNLDWMNAGTNLALNIPIVGKDSADFSCRITHDRARIIECKRTIVDGDFIGISGKATLMAVSGAIGLSVVTINDVTSYLS